MILNARAANGAFGSAGRSTSSSVFEVDALDRGDVERRRQVVEDRVEQGLDALVLERGAAGDRGDAAGEAPLAEGGPKLIGSDVLFLEDLLHERVVVVGGQMEQLVTIERGVVRHVGRDLARRGVDALVVLVEEDGVHLDEVDDADELLLGADRQLQERRLGGRGGPSSSRRRS